MLHIGLNPYGLTYTLGLQGIGTPRANPAGTGLDGFVALADDVGARCLEMDWRWFAASTDAEIRALGGRLRAADMTPIVSAWLLHQPGETLADAMRIASAVGARLIRLHLTPVLEGARAKQGARWTAMLAHARATLQVEAEKAAALQLDLAIENHQDLGSEELIELAAEAGPNVGIVLDTGNPFAVGEDPVAFTRRAAHRIRHVHLKDYRAQFTDEGYRLVRCAIGDGCVPLVEMAAVLETHGVSTTASIEPAALEARHIRLFTSDWWLGYPPRAAAELAVALGRLRHRRIASSDDCRTPWEHHAAPAELIAYELDHLRRSVAHLRALRWM